jgi:HEAT repeat protein
MEKITDKATARAMRGQTTLEEDNLFLVYSDQELFGLINDVDARNRTSAAKLLGVRKCIDAIPILCERLKLEEALYSRIAICNALGVIGEQSIPALIDLIGKIGSNQHESLPEQGFYKRSYPLPRDLAVRTIIRIGVPALRPLEHVVLTADRYQRLEAIDGIGQIAFYEGDLSSEPVLLKAYKKYSSDQIVAWKIIRAFQAFPTGKVRELLEVIIRSNPRPELRWEAVRSLGQHRRNVTEDLLELSQNDVDGEVRKISKLFLKTSQA